MWKKKKTASTSEVAESLAAVLNVFFARAGSDASVIFVKEARS